MARRASIGAFSLPSGPGCLSPTSLAERIAAQSRVSAFLGGAVFASLMATMWLTHLSLKRADVIPYVADGGVFGCEVKTVAPPPHLPMKSEP